MGVNNEARQGLLHEVNFSLKDNEYLAYESQQKTFCAIGADAALANNTMFKVRRMAKNVNACMSPEALSGLKEAQLLHLAVNVRHINKLYDLRNTKIDQSRWLRFLDALIRIITCGLTRFKYKNINVAPLENQIIEQLKTGDAKTGLGCAALIQNLAEMQEEFTSFPTLSKYLLQVTLSASADIDLALEEPEFAKTFSVLMLTRFAELNDAQKKRFMQITETMLARKIALPEWEKAPIEQWKTLLNAVAKLNGADMVYFELQQALYNAASQHYGSLGSARNDFFTILLSQDQKLEKTDRRIEIGLMKYLAKNLNEIDNAARKKILDDAERIKILENAERRKILDDVGRVKILLSKIPTYGELTEKERGRVVLWLNTLKFDLFDKGEEFFKTIFGEEGVKQWMTYLVDPARAKVIAECSKFALQLCYTTANNGWSEEGAEIPKVLQHLNLIGLVDENPRREFHELTVAGPLAAFYKANPDRFLGQATEEQLTSFYTPLEKNIYMNRPHINIPLVEKTAPVIPPLPPGVTVKLNELTTMFDQLNFTDTTHKNYVSPATVLDEGAVMSPENARAALASLIKNVQARPPGFWGAPADPVEHKAFFDNITRALEHIVYRLRSRPPADRSAALVQIAAAGKHCGGRFIGNILAPYYDVTGQQVNIEVETIDAIMWQTLAKRRKVILEGTVYQYEIDRNQGGNEADVHATIAGNKFIGPKFGVDVRAYEYKDQFENDTYAREDVQQEILKACEEAYPSTVIINEATQRINGGPGHDGDVIIENEADREFLIQWFKDNMPPEKKKSLGTIKSEYDKRKKELEAMKANGKLLDEIKRYIRENITKQYDIGVLADPTNWDEVEKAIDAAILTAKKGSPLHKLKQSDERDDEDKGSIRKELQASIKNLTSPDEFIKCQLSCLLKQHGVAAVDKPQKWDVVEGAIRRKIELDYLNDVVFVKNEDDEATPRISREAITHLLVTIRALTLTPQPDIYAHVPKRAPRAPRVHGNQWHQYININHQNNGAHALGNYINNHINPYINHGNAGLALVNLGAQLTNLAGAFGNLNNNHW